MATSLSMKMSFKAQKLAAYILILNGSLWLFASVSGLDAADVAQKRSDSDIIMAKGKLVMRGGKGQGNIILDMGSQKPHSHSMPMMHFNPYLFYPMQHHGHAQVHHPRHHMMFQPIFIEDHSAMHHQPQEHHHHQEEHKEVVHHHQPEHQEYHHEPEVQHHEMHQEHHEPIYEEHHGQHHFEHHEPEHHEMHQEHHEPEHHVMHQEHHESQQQPQQYPMVGSEHGLGGLGSQQMMSMMMHGSSDQPSFQQAGSIGGQPLNQVVGYNQAALAYQQQQQQASQTLMTSPSQASPASNESPKSESSSLQAGSAASDKPATTTGSKFLSSKNPLAALIKPLFKRNPLKKDKKPVAATPTTPAAASSA